MNNTVLAEHYKHLLTSHIFGLVEARDMYLRCADGERDEDLEHFTPLFDALDKLLLSDDSPSDISDTPEQMLRYVYDLLCTAESLFNIYTVQSGKSRLHFDIEEVYNPLSEAKDNVATQLGLSDAPDRIDMHLNDARIDLTLAIEHFNAWAIDEGHRMDEPHIAVTNGHIAYAIEMVEALMNQEAGI